MEFVNPNGNTNTLYPVHPGNTNAVKSGAFSRSGRILAPRAAEIADALMEAPHVVELDRIAAEEIGQLVALVEAIDLDIAERGLRSRRSLLELRLRASGRLEKWLPSSGGRRSHAPPGPQRLRKVGSRPRSLDGVLERTMTEDVRAVLEAIAFAALEGEELDRRLDALVYAALDLNLDLVEVKLLSE